MTVMPLAEITDRAIDLLKREMGVADTIRFLNQFRTGTGNWAEEREAMFGDLTLEQIAQDIKGHGG